MSEDPGPKGVNPRDLALLLAAAGLVSTLAVALYFVASKSPSEPLLSLPPPAATGSVAPLGPDGLPVLDSQPIALKVADTPVQPALLVDVHAPARLRQALVASPWVQQLLAAPLYQGFVGGWLGFFGTRGEDLGGAFSQSVFDLVADRLLSQPFRAVWFSGKASARTPAIIVDEPGADTLAAYELLTKVAQRGRYHADRCPPLGASAATQHAPASAPAEDAAPAVVVERWLLADQPLFVARHGTRLVLASRPLAVVHGACVELPARQAVAGVDLELEVRADRFGRAPQLLERLAGLRQSPRLAFAVQDGKLTPQGIRASGLEGGRLATAPASAQLLQLIPEDMEVVLLLNLALPSPLRADTLRRWFAGDAVEELSPRQLAVLWTPHGSRGLATEVALVWNRLEDRDDLAALFSGGNAMTPRELCQHLVLASSEALHQRLAASCAGKQPSLRNAAPAVLTGLQQQTSIGLTVQLGRTLWRLTEDAYRAEQASTGPADAPLPDELVQTEALLRSLPWVGLLGVARDGALVPGGFRS